MQEVTKKRRLNKTLKIILLAVVFHGFMVLSNRFIKKPNPIIPDKVLYEEGKNDEWNTTNFNENNGTYEIPSLIGNFCIEAIFNNIEKPTSTFKMKELAISILGSYNAYVNGVFVGSNGKVGNSKPEEIIGFLDYNIVFSDSLLDRSTNIVTLKVSNFNNNSQEHHFTMELHNYHREDREVVIKPMILFTLAGIFLTVAIYYLFLFTVSQKKLGYLVFSILCMSLFIFIIQSNSRLFWPYLYTQYYTWKWTSNFLSLVAAILLPIFLIENFNVSKKYLIFASSFVVIVISNYLFINDEMAPLFFSALIGTAINVWAIFNKRVGAWESLAGLLIFLVGAMTFDLSLFIGFAVLVFSNLFSLSVIQRQDRRDHEMSLLRSSRLEAELLKKHLKPHFLMNTLTNIISLIETKPKLSISMIESLSEEFHQLNIMTNKNLIPISHEIKLCESHLNVMRIRNDINYKFDWSSFNTNLQIPPAIIHTLLENGITHNDVIDGIVHFNLEITKKGTQINIEFISTGQYESSVMNQEGTGLGYIRSRLEENYSGKWSMKTGPISNIKWRTLIQIDL